VGVTGFEVNKQRQQQQQQRVKKNLLVVSRAAAAALPAECLDLLVAGLSCSWVLLHSRPGCCWLHPLNAQLSSTLNSYLLALNFYLLSAQLTLSHCLVDRSSSPHFPTNSLTIVHCSIQAHTHQHCNLTREPLLPFVSARLDSIQLPAPSGLSAAE